MTLIYFIQQAINFTSFITMLVIEMFIDGFGDLISWILSNLLKLIPGIGFILGWLGGWIFGIIIGRFFNGSRKNKMNSYYYSYVKKEKSW